MTSKYLNCLRGGPANPRHRLWENHRFSAGLWQDGGEAAVADKGLSGYHSGFIAEEPGRQAGDFVGITDAAQRMHFFRHLPGLLAGKERLGEGSVGKGGGDCVDPESAAGVGRGGRANHCFNSSLGGGDRFMIGDAYLCGGRAKEEEVTITVALHPFRAGTQGVEGGTQVLQEGGIPVFRRSQVCGLQVDGTQSMRVGIDFAVCGNDLIEVGIELCGVGGVAGRYFTGVPGSAIAGESGHDGSRRLEACREFGADAPRNPSNDDKFSF